MYSALRFLLFFVVITGIWQVPTVADDWPDYRRVKTDFGYIWVHPHDVSVATDEGKAVRSRAKDVFLLDDVRFAIVEEGVGAVKWSGSDGALITYTWPFPNGFRRLQSRPPTTLLRHEIGHDLFTRYLVPRSTAKQYSTDAPDWLDEMAAIAFESDDRRVSRRDDIALEELLPLTTLLRMTHPELGAPIIRQDDQEFADSIASSDLTIPFYTTVGSFYDFLVQKTGEKSIVAEMANAFIQDKNLEIWLLERLGYDKEQTSLNQLSTDFRKWFADNR
jgi:hypothetical protein